MVLMGMYGVCSYVEAAALGFILLRGMPNGGEKFPTVLIRSPYVQKEKELSEEETIRFVMKKYENFLQSGYAVGYQHCRGCGKSEGDCIP